MIIWTGVLKVYFVTREIGNTSKLSKVDVRKLMNKYNKIK